CGVCDEYGINWVRWLRETPLPGVAAMLTPTSNPEASTCDGHPPLWRTSCTQFLRPLTMLLPPVSNALRIAAGLPARVFVGASASTKNLAAKRAFASRDPLAPA